MFTKNFNFFFEMPIVKTELISVQNLMFDNFIEKDGRTS